MVYSVFFRTKSPEVFVAVIEQLRLLQHVCFQILLLIHDSGAYTEEIVNHFEWRVFFYKNLIRGGNNTTSLLHAKKIEVKLYKTNTHRYTNPFFFHSTSTIPAFYRALIWAKTLVAEAVHDPTNITKVYTSLEFVLSFNLSQSHPSLFHFSLLLSFWCFSNFLNCCLLFFRYNSSFFTIQ